MNHKYHDVIVAFSEGKSIQCKYIEHNHWIDVVSGPTTTFPDFNAKDVEWRIKPAAKIIKYRLALMERGLYSANYYVQCFNDHPMSFNPETDKGFRNWITDWQEYEIIS